MITCNINKYLIITGSIVLFFSCSRDKLKVDSEFLIDDIVHIYGYPAQIDTIVLKKGISLYEYQGNLESLIPSNDSLKVIEHIYNKGNKSIAIWMLSNGNRVKIIDILEWDKTKIQY